MQRCASGLRRQSQFACPTRHAVLRGNQPQADQVTFMKSLMMVSFFKSLNKKLSAF
jgi:hypothetical protein